MSKENIIEKRVREYQHKIFGQRYEGASLSHCSSYATHVAEALQHFVTHAVKGENNFLVMSGPPGTGKTYLLAALIPWIVKNFCSYRIWKEEELFAKLRESIQRGWDYEIQLKQILDDEVFCLDDLGTNRGNEFHQESMYIIANTRYHMNKPTIITTNLTRREIGEKYGKRVEDRFFSKDSTHIDLSAYPSLRQ